MKSSILENPISVSVESTEFGFSTLSLSQENVQAFDLESRFTSDANNTNSYESSTNTDSTSITSSHSLYDSGSDHRSTVSMHEIESDLAYLIAQFKPRTMEELKNITAIRKRVGDRQNLAKRERQCALGVEVQTKPETSQFLVLAPELKSTPSLPTTFTTSASQAKSKFLVLTVELTTCKNPEEQDAEAPRCPCPRRNGRVYNVNHDTRQCIKEHTRRKNQSAWIQSLPVGSWISVRNERGHYDYFQKTLGDYY